MEPYKRIFQFLLHKYHQINNKSWISLNWVGSSPQETEEAFHRMLFLKQIPQFVVSKNDLGIIFEERFGSKSKQEVSDFENTKLTKFHERFDVTSEYIAPRDEIEEKFVNIWQQVIGIEPIGINDDFFELGGDSLKAMTIISRIHKRFKIEIPFKEFFKLL